MSKVIANCTFTGTRNSDFLYYSMHVCETDPDIIDFTPTPGTSKY